MFVCVKTKQDKPVISVEGVRKFTKTLNIAFSLIPEACLSTARIRKFICVKDSIYRLFFTNAHIPETGFMGVFTVLGV